MNATEAKSVGQWLNASFFSKKDSFSEKGSPSLLSFQNTYYSLDLIQSLVDKKLNYNFSDKSFLFQALSHSSFVKECPREWHLTSNERLEFLGDAVLGQVVSEKIFVACPNASEGECSLLRGSIVNEQSLAELAKFYGLGECLLLSRGEISSQGHEKKSILADAMEALVGAIFLDGGYDAIREILLTWFEEFETTQNIPLFCLSRIESFDPKTKLQEKTMELYKSLPIYESEQLEDYSFSVTLFIDGKKIGTRNHISKKAAQKMLAQETLNNNLNKLPERNENVVNSES